jgi:hypothetical protein
MIGQILPLMYSLKIIRGSIVSNLTILNFTREIIVLVFISGLLLVLGFIFSKFCLKSIFIDHVLMNFPSFIPEKALFVPQWTNDDLKCIKRDSVIEKALSNDLPVNYFSIK